MGKLFFEIRVNKKNFLISSILDNIYVFLQTSKNKINEKNILYNFCNHLLYSYFFLDHNKKDEYEVRYIKQAIHLNSDVQYHLRNEIAVERVSISEPKLVCVF